MRHLLTVLLALVTLTPAWLNAQPVCGQHTLHGGYAFYYTSGVPTTPTYGVGMGVVSFDGVGKGVSKETASINGFIASAESNVTYTVNSDCSGAITWTYPTYGNLVIKANIAIADNGKIMYTIGTDNGSISYGVYTKQ